MTINRALFSILLIGLFNACGPSEDITLNIIKQEDTGLYVAGEIREAGQSECSDFRINFDGETDLLDKTFWHGTVSAGELSATYILGNYATETTGTKPLFGLQFWSDNLPANRPWTDDELANFFAPGTTFSFGRGPGHVEVLLKLPVGGGPYDFEASRPSYLADPQGTLTITELEDYDYPTFSTISERSYGKLVRCTFSGQLGRYNLEADQADGNPSVFLTDEIVELRNCELLFYVEYEEI